MLERSPSPPSCGLSAGTKKDCTTSRVYLWCACRKGCFAATTVNPQKFYRIGAFDAHEPFDRFHRLGKDEARSGRNELFCVLRLSTSKPFQ